MSDGDSHVFNARALQFGVCLPETYRLFESSMSVGEIWLEPYRFRKLNYGIIQLAQPRQGDSQVETCIRIVRP